MMPFVLLNIQAQDAQMVELRHTDTHGPPGGAPDPELEFWVRRVFVLANAPNASSVAFLTYL